MWLETNFIKEDLRLVFANIYNQAISEIPISSTKNDVFQFILNKSMPKNNTMIHSAVIILMAYYFECCDIFETPIDLTLDLWFYLQNIFDFQNHFWV